MSFAFGLRSEKLPETNVAVFTYQNSVQRFRPREVLRNKQVGSVDIKVQIDQQNKCKKRNVIDAIKEYKMPKTFIFKTLISCVLENDIQSLSYLMTVCEENRLIDNYNEAQDKKGNNLLAIATAKGAKKILLTLLHFSKLDINAQNKLGYTSLAVAGFYGRIEMLQMLLSFNADVTVRTVNRESCLIIVALRVNDAEDALEYYRYMNMLRVLVLRSRFIKKSRTKLEDYDANDQKSLKLDHRIKAVLKEWIRSKAKLKTLWIPPYEMYNHSRNGVNLLTYHFKRRRQEIRYMTWCKILLLLFFIVYDIFFEGFTYNVLCYVALYSMAYHI